ncbi:MAG: glycoside hydrolase family 1 protein [Deltaproteobacteria bacterium]|nr:MAG: glycoside hydrolase family 1 protein [Deltaproteobacteria bacterium]
MKSLKLLTVVFSVIIGLILVLSCGDDEREAPVGFPEDFLWGTATAGFQVEMGCPTAPCNDENSDWYQWVTDPGIIEEGLVSGELPESGPGHYELYDTDFSLARDQIANNAFRMSIEWSRIFPTSTEEINGYDSLKSAADPDEIQHYHDVFDSLKSHGIKPLVTLNHYSLPLWVHDGVACHADIDNCSPAGWLDEELIINEIAKYSGFVAREYGGKVDLWATLNEPQAVILAGYFIPSPERTNPPGIMGIDDTSKGVEVLFNMIEAHARMYDAVHQNDTADADGDGVAAEVGLVHNLTPFIPQDPESELDQEAAENGAYFFNNIILNGTIKGDLDTDLDGVIDEHRDDLAGRMDYLGINCYTRVTVTGLDSDLGYPILNFIPSTLWEFYPKSIYDVIMMAKPYGLPVIITENGTADPEGDETGPKFLIPHLSWVLNAIRDGADVRGYFYWTFMDNYEWNHGLSIKMGMFSFDPTTKARTPKLNASVYREIASNNSINEELLEKYCKVENEDVCP